MSERGMRHSRRRNNISEKNLEMIDVARKLYKLRNIKKIFVIVVSRAFGTVMKIYF